jgi:hypothetical protein
MNILLQKWRIFIIFFMFVGFNFDIVVIKYVWFLKTKIKMHSYYKKKIYLHNPKYQKLSYYTLLHIIQIRLIIQRKMLDFTTILCCQNCTKEFMLAFFIFNLHFIDLKWLILSLDKFSMGNLWPCSPWVWVSSIYYPFIYFSFGEK